MPRRHPTLDETERGACAMTDAGTDRTAQPGPDDPEQPDTVDGEIREGPDANDLEADIAVEEDMIETVDPDNPPA
jgi:hypothetical protein